MFDAAHAFGCSHGGRLLGSFGECEVFSFHATKFFNTFEGGAIVTNDDELAAKIGLMRNFGFAGYDNVIYPGTNGKMTEIAAAMGLTNLRGARRISSPSTGATTSSIATGYQACTASRCSTTTRPSATTFSTSWRSSTMIPHDPRRAGRDPARRKRAGAQVLLAWLPQHGAV